MQDHMFYPWVTVSSPRWRSAFHVCTCWRRDDIRTTVARALHRLELKKQIDEGGNARAEYARTGPYLEGAGSWALKLHQLTGSMTQQDRQFWLDQGVDNFKAYMFITTAELWAAMYGGS